MSNNPMIKVDDDDDDDDQAPTLLRYEIFSILL
jgi:hypothetical protein